MSAVRSLSSATCLPGAPTSSSTCTGTSSDTPSRRLLEIPELTSLVYDAREHAIGLVRDEAGAIGADDVVGIRTHITEFGGLLEFLAIGTAVKRVDGLTTLSPSLPPQAIMKDKDTWIGEHATQIDRPGGAHAAKTGTR